MASSFAAKVRRYNHLFINPPKDKPWPRRPDGQFKKSPHPTPFYHLQLTPHVQTARYKIIKGMFRELDWVMHGRHIWFGAHPRLLQMFL